MTVETDDQPLRPPECCATRVDASNLSSSSDEELSTHHKNQLRKNSAKKDLPPNGMSSGQDNRAVRSTTTTNGSSNPKSGSLRRQKKILHSPNISQQQSNASQLPPLARSPVRCVSSSDQKIIKRSPSMPFIFSGPKKSSLVQELKLENHQLPFKLKGGSEFGQLLMIGEILDNDLRGKLDTGDVLLSANKLLLSGKTLIETVNFLQQVVGANNSLEIEYIKNNQIPHRISDIFADNRWINLHVVIRDNALLYTCPYTTRPAKPTELNGQDYQFVSVQEFHTLCASGFFLEWTENSDGHLYGTPKPPQIELDPVDREENGHFDLKKDRMVQQKERESPSFMKGPLPSNWEISYTDTGEKYYIDHNSGTTQWHDPREQLPPHRRSSAIDFASNGHENGHEEEELPEGWERIDDETHGTFYVDHVNKRTQYERPEFPHKSETLPRNGYTSTGITTSTQQQQHRHHPPEPPFPPPVYHPVHHHHHQDQPSPSGLHHQQPQMWRNGVSPSVKRRSQQQYQHHFTTDPSQLKGELLTTRLYKGPSGFGFTLIGNDGGNINPEYIQIKSILPNGPASLDNTLHTGDILVYVDNECMLGASQDDACSLLRSIPPGEPVTLQVCRGYPLVLDPTNKIINLGNVYSPIQPSYLNKWHDQMEIVITKGQKGFGFTITDSPQGQRVKSILYPDQCPNLFENDLILEVDGQNALVLSHSQLVQLLQDFPVGYQTKLLISRHSPKNRSRTPTAGFRFGEKNRTTPLPIVPRSKTPAPQQTRTFRPPQQQQQYGNNTTMPRSFGANRQDIYEDFRHLRLNSEQPYGHYNVPSATPNYIPLSALATGNRHSATPLLFNQDPKYQLVTVNLLRKADGFGFRLVGGSEMGTPLQVGNLIKGGAAYQDGRLQEGDEIVEINDLNVVSGRHDSAVNLIKHAALMGHVKLVVRRLKDTWSNGYNNYTSTFTDYAAERPTQTYDVHLVKNPNEDFGCTLVTIEHRFIGRIIPGTPAERCGRLKAGDCVAMINGFTTTHMTHRQVIDYIKSCGNQVTFTIDPTIQMPRYAAPQHNNGVVNGPIEAEDAIYTTSNNQYGTLTNGHNGTHHQSNGNIVMGNGLDYLNQEGDKDYKLLTVELARGVKNFGFSIRGGFEFGRMPLFILRIADDGPAAQEGSLKVGDQLMEINGEQTQGMTHERAIALIREQPTVRLVVKRKLLPALN